jgi:hypothetical protein
VRLARLLAPGNPPVSSPVNGVRAVTGVPGRRQFQVTLTANPGTLHSDSWYYATLGVSQQGGTVDGGAAGVMEANRVFHCRIGGPYHDTWSTRCVLARDNHFTGVVNGPYQNMGGAGDPMKPVSLTANTQPPGDGKTATFTTAGPHGLQVGQAVTIANVQFKEGGVAPNGTYNGTYAIITLPGSSQFSYRMINAVAEDAKDDIGTAHALWVAGWILAEGNVIDLSPAINYWGQPVGISTAVFSFSLNNFTAFSPFLRSGARHNIVRYVDGRTESVGTPAQGVWLIRAKEASVRNNVAAVASPYGHIQKRCFEAIRVGWLS